MSLLPRSLARSAASFPSRAIARRSYAYASTADLVKIGSRLIPNGVGRKWDIIVEDGKGLDVTLGVSTLPLGLASLIAKLPGQRIKPQRAYSLVSSSPDSLFRTAARSSTLRPASESSVDAFPRTCAHAGEPAS
jgi:hypothetical protein